MEPTNFTFLNTSGASSLSRPAAKRMRAHITKTNFAKRRQRITGTTATETEPKETLIAQRNCAGISTKRGRRRSTPVESNLEVALPLILTHPGPTGNVRAVRKIQELVFLEGRYTPDSPGEVAWVNLIASDPALVEASMAVAVQQWSPDNSWQSKADHHSYKAVNLIRQRIASTTTPTDGVLGAVITMALGASLTHDDLAWNIHIDGLAHIINDRKFRNIHTVPSWFIDLIVQDSINSIFSFPRVYHQSIINALGDYHDRRISRLASICDSIIQLRKMVDCNHEHSLDPDFVAREIEEPLARLHYEARALRASDNPHIDAAARAIELVLYLLWPSQSGAHLTLMASELKEAICRFPIKGCAYMDLTSFQLMIGAIAADKGSLTRTWFVNRLSRPVRWMQLRGWSEPLSILQKRFVSDVGLIGQFKDLWRELHNANATLNIQSSTGSS